jgi:hypothetical protein
MCSTAAHAASVASLRKGLSVEISGFELADDGAHMIAWLGKGKDFRQFIVNDVETELYAQDKTAQVLSVRCKSTPRYETRARPDNDGSSKAVVTSLSVTFPLVVRVRASNGKVWQLDINHNYFGTNLDVPAKRKLDLNFGIVGQNAE